MDIIPDDVLTDIFTLAAEPLPLPDFDDFILDRSTQLVEVEEPSSPVPDPIILRLMPFTPTMSTLPLDQIPFTDAPYSLFNAGPDSDGSGFGSSHISGSAQSFEDPAKLQAWYRKEDNWSVSISHVCSRWRDLALQTGELWTVLWFNSSNRTGQAPLNRHSVFLQRSKNCPLSVVIMDPTWQQHDFESIMAGNLHRVVGLTIGAQSHHLVTYLNAILPHCASSLKSLAVISTSPRSKVSVDYSVLATFKSLTHLLLRYVPLGFFPSNPSSLLGNLTNLKLVDMVTRVSFGAFIAAITASSSLETLYLNFAQPPESQSLGWHVTLPSLHRLSIECGSVSFITALAEHVRMPKLKALRLDLQSIRPANAGHAFVHALTGSLGDGGGCLLSRVEVLFLSGDIICDDELIPIFYKSAPELQYLHLDLRHLPRNFLVALSRPIQHPEPDGVVNRLEPFMKQDENILRGDVEIGLYDIRRQMDFCDHSDRAKIHYMEWNPNPGAVQYFEYSPNVAVQIHFNH